MLVFLLAKGSVWAISEKNKFERLLKIVNKNQSEVNTAKSRLVSVLEGASDLYGWALGREAQAVNNVVGNNKLSSDQLLFSGQIYPDYNTTLEASSSIVDQAYYELRSARTKLNNSIAEYNTAIRMFPGSIIADGLGYKEVVFIDQENLNQALNLPKRESVELH